MVKVDFLGMSITKQIGDVSVNCEEIVGIIRRI